MRRYADLRHSLRVTGSVFLDAEFSAPWCVTARIGPEDCSRFAPEPKSIAAFHYVSEGRLLLGVANHAPVVVEAGEIVVLPQNDVHTLGSDLDLAPVEASTLIEAGDDGTLGHIDHGGGGEVTRIVCGFLGTDRQHEPALVVLPKVLTLQTDESAVSEWIRNSFQFAAEDMATGLAKSPETLVRLAELLFLETVERYLESLPEEQNAALDAALDPRLAHALELFHREMNRHWTSEEVAKLVGMSRSAFAERFTNAMHSSPMRYLARLRLNEAARRLQESQEPVASIAYDVGYESEVAFNRAFKREFGTPPATWRKQQLAESMK